MNVEVIDIGRDDTYGLRRAVLRNGDPDAVVAWAEDDTPGTMHLGARLDGVLVGTSTWSRAFPDDPPDTERQWQLRGMATADGVRGTGVGGVLVEAGCLRCAGAGGRLVWARARDAALRFYARHGFDVVGDGFIDATTALPHHVVRRALD